MTTGCIRLVCNMLFVVYVICPPSLRLAKYIWNTTCLVFFYFGIAFWMDLRELSASESLWHLARPPRQFTKRTLVGFFVLFICCLLIFSNLISLFWCYFLSSSLCAKTPLGYWCNIYLTRKNGDK